MKYLHIYQNIMNRYKDKIEETNRRYNVTIKENELPVIIEFISRPYNSPGRMAKFLDERRGLDINSVEVTEILDSFKLYSPEIRKKEAEKVLKNVAHIKKMLDGDEEACQQFGSFIAEIVTASKTGKCTDSYAKFIVTYICCADKELASEEYYEIPKNYKEPYCQRLLKDIYKAVAVRLDLEDMTEKANTYRLIESSRDDEEQETETAEEKDAEIAKLNAEIADLRSSLQILEADLEEIRGDIDKKTEEAKNSAISDFFIKLNSSQYGNILDSMVLAEENRKALRRQKIQLPPLLLNVPIIIRQLLSFFEDIGIEQIDEKGREFKAKYSDLENYTYQGSSYVGDEEKDVYISSPGWHYGDIVISRPTVSEKE